MSRDTRIVILYEDSGHPGDFGPHEFVCACIADIKRELTPWQIGKMVSAHPTNGNSKLLKTVSKDLERLRSRARHVFAVFDNDEVRRLLSLEADACRPEVLEAFAARIPNPEHLTINLVEENTETILEKIADEMSGIDAETKKRAIVLKKTQDRDLILRKAAAREHERVRESVLASMPSLRRLVVRCRDILSSEAD